MSRTTEESEDVLSPGGLQQLILLLAQAQRARLSSAQIDGRTVWIKRCDVDGRLFAQRLHVAISPILPLDFLRSARPLPGEGPADQEVRRAARFRDAGFATPSVLFRNGQVLVMAHVAPTVHDRLKSLRGSDPAAHDALLVRACEALARVHGCGLCHGRPHPRDMFEAGERWGFLDFEEEPERAMPLATAQARDAWLLFMQVASRSLSRETMMKAFSAYCSGAPSAVVTELRRIVSFFSRFLLALRIARPFGLGRDGRDLLNGTAFLRQALAAGLSFPIPSR